MSNLLSPLTLISDLELTGRRIILRYVPDLETIYKEIRKYKRKGYFKEVSQNLKKYFQRKTSKGCLMVEKENGPDEYIYDLRQDIFERFSQLQLVLNF